MVVDSGKMSRRKNHQTEPNANGHKSLKDTSKNLWCFCNLILQFVGVFIIESNQNINILDFYHQGKQRSPPDDDFTRLTRLEKRVDATLEHYSALCDELSAIEESLLAMRAEFDQEFKHYIVDQGNGHTIQIGNRLLTKLNHFKVIQQTIVPNTAAQVEPRNDETKKTSTKSINKKQPEAVYASVGVKTTKKPVNGSQPKNVPSNGETTNNVNDNIEEVTGFEPNRIVNSTPIKGIRPSTQHKPMRMERQYSPISSSSAASSSAHTKQPNSLSDATPSEPSLPPPMDPYNFKAIPVRLTNDAGDYEYNQIGLPLAPPPPPQSSNQPGVTPLYLNMSMSMHSTDATVEGCFRQIERLRQRIINYRSDHKLKVYQEMRKEIIYLMNRLDTVQPQSESSDLARDKNIAQCELHNLAGMLERSVMCTDHECVLCNSFIYKPEISVWQF